MIREQTVAELAECFIILPEGRGFDSYVVVWG